MEIQTINVDDIKSLRKELGYNNAKELSKLLGFGSATIPRWESGMSPMSKSHGLMGTIHLSEDEMKGFMKDFAKYIHGDKNEK